MGAPVFLAPTADLAGDTVVVTGPEGRHAATVTRLRAGEVVELVDGLGLRVRGVVAGTGPDTLTVTVRSREAEPVPSPRVVVVQALAKGDRGETAVETLSEVGADVVVPWSASRSVTQWREERGEKARQRWVAVARAAGKQSRRARHLEVAPLASTAEVTTLLRAAALGVVLHEQAASPLAGVTVPAAGDVVVVVGPEGGLTESEVAQFAAVGAGAYLLGPSVLRTSTAGTVAAAVLLARSGRWG